jgi:lysophospholipase L1-like esterase
MLAAPEDSAKVTANYNANSPRLDYQINFTETGTHYIWVLGYGPTSSSDSVHVGLDSDEIASAAGIGPFDPEDNWVWEDRGGASIQIASPGVHTLNLWMRESGISVDRILLTTDPSFIPGPGLAESPRGSACGSAPTVEITSPVAGDFQSKTDLFVTTRTCLEGASHSGWGIRVRADGGPSAGGSEAFAYTSPWSVTLFGLALAEHVIDADVVDESGNPVAGSQTHDQVSQIGIGDGYLAIGDSVTLGVGDDDPSDDTSQDGRVTGGGFAPILNDLLSSPPTKGYPHRIINNGVGGETSAGGLQELPGVLSAHPDADRVLIMYGMNDARPWLPVPSGLGLSPGDGGYPGTYKDNMQQIVDLVNADGREAMLATVNIALGDSTNTTPYPDPNLGARSVLIQEYNDVVDELVADNANGINVTPPNFYSHFEVNHPTEYSDNIHPNGAGYDSMADLWFNALTQ